MVVTSDFRRSGPLLRRVFLRLIVAITLVLSIHSPASTQAPVAASAKSLSNQDVLDLIKGGFSDELIVARIVVASSKSFDLSTTALLALKKVGASERVIQAMLTGGEPGKSSSSAASPGVGSAGREAGIYLAQDGKWILLEPTVFSGGKSGGRLASIATYGLAKSNWKAIVRSPYANQRVSDGQPVFNFLFERGGGVSTNSAFGGATSPSEFVLAKMKATPNERELIVGEFGVWVSNTGPRSKDTVPLTIERLSQGLYRVTPAEVLTEGEYCFFYAAGIPGFLQQGVGKLFDFGIDRR